MQKKISFVNVLFLYDKKCTDQLITFFCQEKRYFYIIKKMIIYI